MLNTATELGNLLPFKSSAVSSSTRAYSVFGMPAVYNGDAEPLISRN
jgi:hypothetical protein